MNVVMLSQDKTILKVGTPASLRIASYGSLFGELVVVVFGAGDKEEVQLNAQVRVVYAGGANKIDSFFKSISALLSITENKKYDVISAQDPFFIGLAGLYVAKRRHIPFQAQLHTDCFSRGFAFASVKNAIQVLIALFVLSRASCVRVVSERIAQSVRSKTKASVSVLPIRVPDRTSPSTERPAVFGGEFTVLTVSRLSEEKRIEFLILAIALTHGINLVVVGDGPERKRLEEICRKLQIQNRVHFVGWQEPDRYYAAADTFALASQYEGYGMALVEAALHGLPLVSTDVGVIGEVFVKTREALVATTPAEFANAFTKLAGDPSYRSELGEAARKKAEGLSVSESEYLERYKEALSLCHL